MKMSLVLALVMGVWLLGTVPSVGAASQNRPRWNLISRGKDLLKKRFNGGVEDTNNQVEDTNNQVEEKEDLIERFNGGVEETKNQVEEKKGHTVFILFLSHELLFFHIFNYRCCSKQRKKNIFPIVQICLVS